tara:strand:+ start:44468 stop:46603 length:2136 start_codon:yes stop_codon:yes gene_type:complete
MRTGLDKKLGLYINVATLVSLIASVLTIYFFVGSLNQNARETDTLLLAQGLEAAARSNETWAVDYGWWADAVTYFDEGDTETLTSSMAAPLQDHSGFDFVLLANESEGREFGWTVETGETVQENLLSTDDLALIRRDLQAQYEQGSFLASHYLTMDGRTYIASVTVLGEYEDRAATDPLTDTILVIGTELDRDFLDTLEQHYLVQDIRFVPGETGMIDGAVPVRDQHDDLVGELVWRPSLPGIETLRIALIPLVIYIAVFLLASQALSAHARKLARAAEHNERRARQAASTDKLSGLPNRHGFTQFVESKAAERAAREGHAAIIYVDLNGFKAVNDKAGHAAGDFVIVEVARRFRQALPGRVSIARMGGDEFACVLIDEDDACHALDLARGLIAALDEPIHFEAREFEIGAAVGVAASYPDEPKSFVTLVDQADLAMYRAKADKLDYPLYYDDDFAAQDGLRRSLDADIELGLGRQEFYVVYQPIIDASTGKTASMEALLRWEHPVRGNVPPDIFIPAAEDSKLIHRLGELVFDAVCKEFDPSLDCTVSINLSPTQLNDPDLCQRFVARLKEHGLSPCQIELEITETVLIEDFGRAKARMDELSEAGFRLNLDDFGTGFASISYLHTLPFSKIKVDKSFVDLIGKDESANKTLQAMALLSDAMKLEIVAEGVETEYQASLLRLLGFTYLQGWYFGQPQTAGARLKSKTAGA